MRRLYFRLGRILSEGKGQQLAWLTGILLLTLLLIIAIIKAFFSEKGIDISNVLALFFGVDSLNDTSGVKTTVMLIIALLGTLLFSTFLISVITNVVDNISDSYRVGKIRVTLSHHTVFLGANHLLVGMLQEISRRTDSTEEILVMTTLEVEELRETIYSYFDGPDNAPFRKRLVFQFAERDQKDNLQAACVADARRIFILGEDDEPAHDSRSIAAVEIISELCQASAHDVQCTVLLEDPASTKAYVMKGKAVAVDKKSRLRLNLVDAYDYMAEHVLAAAPDVHTPIDHGLVREGDSVQIVNGIGKDAAQYVHLVISGSGPMAEAFARTAFAMLHFPNFDEKTGERRTVISFISPDAGKLMNRFRSNYENVFMISHCRFVGKEESRTFVPDAEYGDYLDVEWEFIEGDLDIPSIRETLLSWVSDDAQSVSIALCDRDSARNATDAISLPRLVHERKTPVFIYQKDNANLLNVASSSVIYGKNLIPFGMTDADRKSGSDADPLYERRFKMAQRVNFAYSTAYGPKTEDEAASWYLISESDKLSSTYCALSIPLKVRSFGIDDTKPVKEQLPAGDCNRLDRVEHRRWMAGVLLLGFYPMPRKDREELVSMEKAALKQKTKDLKARFIHWDLESFDVIGGGEQEKDTVIMNAIPYVMTGNRDLL